MKPNPSFENDGVVDRKGTEDALRENEERYRTLFELPPSPSIPVMAQV